MESDNGAGTLAAAYKPDIFPVPWRRTIPMPRKTVLFLTSSEYGQANTILAQCAELLTHEDINVHVSSFSKLQKRVKWLQNRMENASSSTITFHPLSDVPTTMDAIMSRIDGDSFRHPPSSRDASVYHMMDVFTAPHELNNYIKLVNELKHTITNTVPDIVVVDMSLAPGIDACRVLHQRYIINSPLQALDMIRPLQPSLRMLWYYPV